MLKTLVRISVLLCAALLIATTGAPSAKAEDNGGYMDQMLRAMSGQAPTAQDSDDAAGNEWVDEASRREIESARQKQNETAPSGPLLPDFLPEPPDDGNTGMQSPATPAPSPSASLSPDEETFVLAALDDSPFNRAPQDIEPSGYRTPYSPDEQSDGTEKIMPAPAAGSVDRLNVGDLLRITVFGVEELSNTYRIDSKGILTVPLVGEIQAQGKTKDELQNEIAQSLIKGGYYNNPSVTVEIMELSPFYILGEVKNPGRYPYEPELDIFKAIAIAGGYTPRAAKDKIIIIRNINGQKTEIEATEATEILPGDSIKVKQRFF
ncbi:MAG: polysaccharide export protein [Alphaproteobacteria bacterium]|nr:polysaccharide export protein [Alphaproteobacteria bacterium]